MSQDALGSGSVGRIGRIVALFAVVGLALGLSGVVVVDQFGGDGLGGQIVSGLLVTVVILVSLLLGPVLAALVGTRLADRGNTDLVSPLVGGGVGYLVMALLVVLTLSVGVGGGGGDGGSADLGRWLVPVLVLTVTTGVVGVAASALVSGVD